MTTEYETARRLGYKIPRSTLLPPYLELNPYYAEYTDAIDHVWTTLHDNGAEALKQIRNPWATNPQLEAKVVDRTTMIPVEDWSIQERQTLVRQVNMLGMKLKTAGVLTDENYQTVSRYLGMYWRGKGTQAFIDFIDFCLGTTLTVSKFWAEVGPEPNSYNNMTLEPSPGTPPGTPIWEGGTWFPTTHVNITALDGSLGHVDHSTLVQFFYEIANYNLVLQSIVNRHDMPIVAFPGDTTTQIVAVGLYRVHQVAISNQGRFGGDPPPIHMLNSLPMTVLAPSVATAQAGPYLGRPDAWFLDLNDRSIPLYGPPQALTPPNPAGSLPTTMMGPLTADEFDPATYVLLAMPAGWTTVPTFPTSRQRIPYWTVQPVARNTLGTLGINMYGNRDAFLTNPAGWLELNPGQFVPYW